jgi:L,D-peptidoglycan transpeptidase YkuD (ErfK/YbiS/YcfS/YnhG family)
VKKHRKEYNLRKDIRCFAVCLATSGMILGAIYSMALTAQASQVITAGGTDKRSKEAKEPSRQREEGPVQVDRFVLPENARVLVVVEGTGGSFCKVSAYEREREGSLDWTLKMSTSGYLGHNGMSNHRIMGDKTTPIGVFQMNTPFGQADPLEGFPDNYVKVTENYVWESRTNRLAESSTEEGERVGTERYKGYYDYVLDAGYNKNAVAGKGAALFLHCSVEGVTGSSGCVEIPREHMIYVMKLYGKYGDGASYIAQAPAGTFFQIYDTYGTNNGLSPEGDFAS